MEDDKQVKKEFPGLYSSEASCRSDSDYNDSSYDKGAKKELVKIKKKEKNKDKGYAALDSQSSEEEMDYLDIKNPLKSKRTKSFKFLHKKDKEEKEKDDKKEDKKKRGKEEKDDKKKEKKKEKEEKLREKEERKLREKEERKLREKEERKIRKEKKKKHNEDEKLYEDCSIFGVPLSIAVDKNRSHDGIRIPVIVRECIDFIEEKGLNCEGIYRISGSKTKVQSLRRAYNAGEVVFLHDQHPHNVATLLKHYLRELPETVLTVDMMPHFEDVSLIPNPRERAEAMRQLIEHLPTPNRLLLQYFLKHMSHVIEKEETKMSYHNVGVVLSPIMQISHRVLNVMFNSHNYLVGNVEIKRYLHPITSCDTNRSVDDLKTEEIEEEMKKQESLLSSLHSSIASGKISQTKEEQLWEAQRIVTLLKRKLKSTQRSETNDSNHLRSESQDVDVSSEESQKEAFYSPSGGKEKDQESSSGDLKSNSESETTETPSFKSVSNNDQTLKMSPEHSEHENNDKSENENFVPKSANSRFENMMKEQIIPFLPKPLSIRTERSKQGAGGREKMCSENTVKHWRKDEPTCAGSQNNLTTKTHTFVTEQQTQIINTVSSNSYTSPHLPIEKESHSRVKVMSDILEDEVINTTAYSEQKHSIEMRNEALLRDKEDCANTESVNSISVYQAPNIIFDENSDYEALWIEDIRLNLEHDELLNMNHELTKKLQFEKSEIARIRDEIQEMQTLYGYRTHSYDSSESEGSESEGESDNEDDIQSQILYLEKNNCQIKRDNVLLVNKIQGEREQIIRLRVALRQQEIKVTSSTKKGLQMC